MAKKEERDLNIQTEVVGGGDKPKIAPVLHDFGRIDLNELRDKVNEIAKRV